MKRILLALVITVLMLSVGCTQTNTPVIENPPPSDANGTTNVVLPADAPPEGITWISPGKVNVGNFYPGARAEYPLTIHNGNDYTCTFEVKYRYPDHVGNGYEMPPTKAQDWVMVVDTTPVLAPHETRDILVVLEIPEGAVVTMQSWEFWVSVIDISQTGMVRTELCCRWLITMRT